MKYIFGVFFLLISIKTSAINNLDIKDNNPFTYVYMNFDGYHKDYSTFLPLFIQEVEEQGLQSMLLDEPFNLYFSETEWAIACRIQKEADVNLPLKKNYYKNTKVVKLLYEGSDENIPSYLDLASSHIYKKNYYWDGYLIINEVTINNNKQLYELVIPVTKDIYKLYIKPYGIVRVIIAFICLLFSIFLLTYNKGRIVSNRILGMFTLICVLRDCSSFMWIFNIYQHWPHLYNFGISLHFIFAPLLLFYSLSVIKKNFKFRKVDAIHLIPFLIVAFIYFFQYQIHDTEAKFKLLENGLKQSIFFEIIYYILPVHVIAYLSFAIIFLYKYCLKSKNTEAESKRILISTLKLLLIGLLVLEFIEIIKEYVLTDIAVFHYTIKGIGIIFNLILISILLIRCLQHSEMLTYSFSNGNGQKYNKSPLTEDHKEFYLEKLESFMVTSKPYLSSTINLPDLAKGISIPARYISQVLNEKLEMSFYDFMNKYRIDEAKNLLSQEKYCDRSIINIAYDCGFNSKSVFNASFKKFTGITPKEYRENQNSILKYDVIHNN
ncbi:helix-turn-helix domain-containing protein [Bacteroidota bacterium]